jgi:hypothetical protein
MWINPQSMQIFTTHSEIRSAFSNVSFPVEMTESDIEYVGLLPVTLTAQPTFDRRIERVVELTPLAVDGTWTQQWAVVALDAAEKSAMAVQIQAEIVTATQQRLDDFAKTRNYDGILSACTYAADPSPKFSAEGQYCIDARGATWTKLYEILAEVEAETRPMPTGYAEIESELPQLVWPN